ncbi:hypothetical protein V1264_000701 [Littorina saxatilis]|uniref:Uncharacterized protein n=1 Tax=Littorina saxatilis TaxID=31220 RepID=A0AAN9GNC7_9CAEN
MSLCQREDKTNQPKHADEMSLDPHVPNLDWTRIRTRNELGRSILPFPLHEHVSALQSGLRSVFSTTENTSSSGFPGRSTPLSSQPLIR